MATATTRKPQLIRAARRGRLFTVRRVLAVLAVVAATLGSGAAALALYEDDKDVGFGSVDLSVSLGHRGALDLYVPLIDWGARFPAIRLPARLHVDVRSIDRARVQRLAAGGSVDVGAVRESARDAIAGYIRALLGVVLAAALAGGALSILVVRGGASPRKRVLAAIVGATAAGGTVALALLLPPRGPLDEPQYYAHGPDIPRALDALEQVRRSGRALDQELNAQLVGLARLVIEPAERRPVDRAPRLTIASDLHNNALTLPILERAARGGPVLFPGDLTDRGTPLETSLVRRVVRSGRPFVFVSGNHDSDRLERELARDGAIVLRQEGRLMEDGGRGPVVVDVAGVRVAGYGSPDLRLARDRYADRYDGAPDPAEQASFDTWLEGLRGQVDVVMVHDAALAATALDRLALSPPAQPLVLAVGHSHRTSLRRVGPVTVIDAGSLGAGGTGNLTEQTKIGLAVLAYEIEPSFEPLAADLVEVDPATGSSTARRERLDQR